MNSKIPKQKETDMIRKLFPFTIVVISVVLISLACGGSVSTANISSVTLSSDEQGSQETTIFTQSDTMYCLVDLKNAPDDTTVKAIWIAVSVEGEAPNTLIDEVELTTETAVLTFDLSNSSLWPVGQYKVDLYLNGEMDQTINFQVQ